MPRMSLLQCKELEEEVRSGGEVEAEEVASAPLKVAAVHVLFGWDVRSVGRVREREEVRKD